ncbi:MAG: hypothetical protein K2L48_00205 [Mycoplasmoidaceae bacterium]|nr:hypothetical protein [Mycoplasmoidaceae bacterium]
MRKQIIDAIKEVAAEQNINIPMFESNFSKPLKEIGIDSISSISMIVGIEQKLGVRVPDDHLPKITSVNLLIEEFQKLLKK